jgi:hypothetical protein
MPRDRYKAKQIKGKFYQAAGEGDPGSTDESRVEPRSSAQSEREPDIAPGCFCSASTAKSLPQVASPPGPTAVSTRNHEAQIRRH